MGYTGVFAALVDNMVNWDPDYFDDVLDRARLPRLRRRRSRSPALRFQHETRISRIVMSKEAIALGLPVSMSAKFADSEAETPGRHPGRADAQRRRAGRDADHDAPAARPATAC